MLKTKIELIVLPVPVCCGRKIFPFGFKPLIEPVSSITARSRLDLNKISTKGIFLGFVKDS